jgi:hypothetical protein
VRLRCTWSPLTAAAPHDAKAVSFGAKLTAFFHSTKKGCLMIKVMKPLYDTMVEYQRAGS